MNTARSIVIVWLNDNVNSTIERENMEIHETIDSIRNAHQTTNNYGKLPISYWREHLISVYNHMTAPYVLRTDQEHRVCRKIAVRSKKILNKLGGFDESDSGRLYSR